MRFGPFLGIALVLFVLWIAGFVLFYTAGILIHLLLLFAIIALILHFVRGRSRGGTDITTPNS
jgi:hypothetical protein